MSNFKEALRKGLDAQEKLTRAQADLRDVLSRVTVELADALGSETQFCLSNSYKLVDAIQTMADKVIGALPREIRKHTWVIEVKNAAHQVTLAEVAFSEAGYPITIEWPGNSAYAADTPSLSNAMESLLSSRITGEKLGPFILPDTPVSG